MHSKNDALFSHKNLIAIGWPEMGELIQISDNRETFKEKYNEIYPLSKKNTISMNAGMIYRFCCEIKEEDHIVFPSKEDCKII